MQKEGTTRLAGQIHSFRVRLEEDEHSLLAIDNRGANIPTFIAPYDEDLRQASASVEQLPLSFVANKPDGTKSKVVFNFEDIKKEDIFREPPHNKY